MSAAASAAGRTGAGMAPALPRSPAGRYNPWMVAGMLSLAPFMELLDTTIANVSLTHIAGSLGASRTESTWVLTSYLVSNSIILPISAWLSQVLGRKRFYQICVALFTASSVLCAASTSLDMIIIARVLQGIGGGGLGPVTQGMLADSFPPQKRGQVFALFGFTVIVAPVIGPLIGGWLTDNLSWHWIFLINLPIGLVAFTLIAIFVSEPPLLVQERAQLLARGLRLDYFGLALVAVGFGSLQIFLDKFEIDDGFASPFICALAALCVVSLCTLFVWEWDHPQPVMNLRLLKLGNFRVACIITFFLGFVLLSSTQLLPQLSQTLLGYDSETSGMLLAVGGIATIFMLPVAGFITGRIVPARWVLCGAFLVLGIALYLQALLPPDVSFFWLSLARVSQVTVLPFVFIPVNAAGYVGMPGRSNGEAAALINQIRNIGGSIGISYVTAELEWRTQFHHARLAEAISPYTSLHGMAISQIAPIVQQQAAFMSYLDLFRITGIIALCVAPINLFLRAR
jgi:DHA2 family multidrug resistance protein